MRHFIADKEHAFAVSDAFSNNVAIVWLFPVPVVLS
jgi:hypothetical protein